MAAPTAATLWLRRALDVADEAFDHDPGPDRDAFVAEACGDDGMLRAEVERLLRADAATHSFLDGRADGIVAQDKAPEQVGAWRVTGELGRGGMGVVYLAERADGTFEKQVALKLARADGDARGAAERFAQERRLLARLRHPGIAALLDGGVAPDGRPYFIMERVEGVPITTAAAGLDLRARIRLAVETCEAVAHAHRLLVVHRDIKPSNVLVETTADGRLQPRLLDFGVAKALDPEGADALQTQTHAPLTPAYAAPEQVTGDPITAATDVYALGVLLYELLTGRRPYAFEDRSLAGIARVVCETQPPRPSQTAPADAEAREAWASDSDPVEPRRLRGDLDAIVMKALRKEPERRYTTAQALADDLRRHLDGRPVEARGDGFAYVASRFVRRHRAATAAALVGLVGLVGGTAAVAWQARQTALEADRANATLDWVLGTFEAVDPQAVEGGEIQAADLIAPGLRRIGELDDQPLVQGAVMEGLGRLSASLGLLPAADSLLRGSIRTQARVLGPDHPDLAPPRLALASALNDQREYEAAEALVRQALATLGPRAEPALRSRALSTLAAIRYRASDYSSDFADVQALYREALALADGDAEPELRLRALTGLAAALSQGGAPEEALAHAAGAVSLASRTYGASDPRTADALSALASLHDDLGQPDRAIALYRQVLGVYRPAYGDADYRVAETLYSLGRLYAMEDDWGEAVRHYREAVDAYSASSLDADHLWRAYALVGLGRALARDGRPAEAAARLREGLAAYAESLDDDDYRVAGAQGYLADALLSLGQTGEAGRLLRTSEATLRAYGFDDPYANGAAKTTLDALVRHAELTGDRAARARYQRERAALDAG